MRLGMGLPGPFFVSFHIPSLSELRDGWDEDNLMIAQQQLDKRDLYLAEGNESKAWAANQALCSFLKGTMRRNGMPLRKDSNGQYPWLDVGSEGEISA